MDNRSLTSEVERLLLPTIEEMGYELIEVEYLNECGRWTLRIYIDSEAGGVKVADCANVSRAASALLDVEDIIHARYNLEVSSPGIERPLRRARDFEKYAGSIVKIRTHNKIDGQRNFKGVLKGIDEKGSIRVDEDGRMKEIPVGEVLKARISV